MSNGGSGVSKFSTGGASERMRIDSSGNVGIGTSSPGAKLSFGQTVQTNLLYIYDGTAGAKYGFGIASSELRIYSGSSASTTIGNFDGTTYTERMRIDSSGNVGIGTSSPTSYVNSGSGFAVVGTNSQTQVFLGSSASGVNVAAYTGAVYFQSTTSADFLIGSSTANPVIFRTNATERMRIDSSGNVGIGATANASAILDAQSTTKGVRFPNMTTTQKNAISSPAAGLVVFDTTLSKLCVYSGAAWQTITSI
jgi:hypothetical protein